MQQLAPAESLRPKSRTNLSRSTSFSMIDRDGNELAPPASFTHPYRFIIPRDRNLIIPSMTRQNVTALNSLPHHFLFSFYHIDINQSNNLTISVHIEIKPVIATVAYLFIYRFDQSPQLNSSLQFIDGFTVFCPSSKCFSHC